MRIFDVYEHPTFETEQADKPTMRTAIRRLGVGAATVSAIAAIGFWGYYWSDSSPPPFLNVMHTALLIAVLYRL
jgi:hypothetical protein